MPWTVEEAGQQYLVMVEPVNAAIGALNSSSKNADLATLKQLCGAVATALDGFSRQLAAGRWPAQAQQAIAAVTTDATGEYTHYSMAANATDLSSLTADVTSIPSSGAAEAVRVALGLPAAPVPS